MIGFVRDMLRVLALPCREQTALHSQQLDAPLPRGVAAGLRVHAIYCGGCRAFRAQVRRLRDLSRSIGQDSQPGDAMPGDVRARAIRRAAEHAKKI